ncbi:MAG: hypothetical protein ABI548_15880 [Polyangiaceae bacterium]
MSGAPSGSATHATDARALGLWSLLALGINGIVGVGISFIPNQIVGLVSGARGVFAYALTLLALLPVALCYAKLGSRFCYGSGAEGSAHDLVRHSLPPRPRTQSGRR